MKDQPMGDGILDIEVRGGTGDDIYFSAPGGTQTKKGDLAEIYYSRDLLQIGDVVVFDPTRHGSVMKSTQSYEHDIVGVVSGKGFANIMSLSESAVNEPNQYPIALLGKMMIKVSLENGLSIKIGDPLTTSSIPDML